MMRIEGMNLLMPFINKLTQTYDLQEFVKYVFTKVADGFFEKPASSTGKHHPEFARREGGLVFHTIKAAEVWDDLWRAYSDRFDDSDVMYSAGLAAVLLHDTCKYGVDFLKENTISNHDVIAADFIYRMFMQYFKDQYSDDMMNMYKCISNAILTHHGKWSTVDKPTSLFNELVFLSDYIASRKWIKLGAD